jgi:hypothetical protein
MKKLFISAVAIVIIAANAHSQTPYEVLKDNVTGGRILKGLISRDIIARDSSVSWYKANAKPYTGKDAGTFAKYKDSVQLVIFLGTWCEDSQYLIPKLFPFLDTAGFSKDRITMIGVDRDKKSISHLTDAFNIINVPTVIVMKQGKELGRVVEYGKYGSLEKEITEIADSAH